VADGTVDLELGRPALLERVPTASSPFVSPGKYGPNFTAKYESCGGDCAAARDGASSVVPTATAARTLMTDFEFIDDPFNEFRPGLGSAQGPRFARETIVAPGNLRRHESFSDSAARGECATSSSASEVRTGDAA
jgi:hypothetical protein